MRKALNVTVPEDLIEKIKVLAEKEHRTVSSMVTVIFKESRLVEKKQDEASGD